MIVLLDCGHWYTEYRPKNVKPPEQGELRVCGIMSHYPREFPAHYIDKRIEEL